MANFGGNMALNIEQILGQKLTLEQQVLWMHIKTIARNPVITPIYLQGDISVTEITVYAAGKLYVALRHSWFLTITGALVGSIQYNDENNALSFSTSNNGVYWDTVAAAVRYDANEIQLRDFYFGRAIPNLYTRGLFVGYRVNY
jgi:hypothetical protein